MSRFINSLLTFVLAAAITTAQHASSIKVTVVPPPRAPHLAESGDKLSELIQRWAPTSEALKILRGHEIWVDIIPIRTQPDLGFILRISKPGYLGSRPFSIYNAKNIEEAFEISKNAVKAYFETSPPILPQQARKVAYAPAAAPDPPWGRPAVFVLC